MTAISAPVNNSSSIPTAHSRISLRFIIGYLFNSAAAAERSARNSGYIYVHRIMLDVGVGEKGQRQIPRSAEFLSLNYTAGRVMIRGRNNSSAVPVCACQRFFTVDMMHGLKSYEKYKRSDCKLLSNGCI